MKTRLSTLLATAALSAAPATGQHLLETLSDTSGGPPGTFGARLGLGADLALVRATVNPYPGSSSTRNDIHVLRRTGFSFALEDVIVDPTVPLSIGFGFSLATNGEQVLVGVPAPFSFTLDGSVYVYEQVGGAWTHVDTVVATGASVTGGDFGFNLAVDGPTLLVAAPFASPPGGPLSDGLVFVFERGPAGWQEVAVLSAPPSMAASFFGTGLDVDGDLAVVGGSDYTPAADRTGGAWLYRRVAGSWTLEQELAPPVPVNDEGRYGSAVAIDGERVAVGARNEDVGTIEAAGAVHLFEPSGGTWSEVARLTSAAPEPSGRFGEALDLDGDELVVGAVQEGALQAGAAYTYHRGASGWQPGPVLSSPLAPGSTGTRFFGGVLRAEDNTALIADVGPVGSGGPDLVRVYDLDAGTTRYCASVPNATGLPAVIEADGSRDVAANRFRLRTTSVSGAFGLVFYGPTRANSPFGVGFRCVASPTYRLRVAPVAGETLIEHVDFSAPPNPAGTITPGSTWNFQAWFRDPAPSSPGFNTSDAVEVRF